MNPNIIAAYALISSLKNSGTTHCVISPGSRSTPLAFVAKDLLECTVVIDERDAGFVALGIAEATRTAPIVITTSGSAPTHLFPSVVEAFHSKIPLIVISADRPHEVRGRGAPQTIDQIELFGSSVRYFFDAPCPHDEIDINYWYELGASLSMAAQGVESIPGPVHLNMGMREPLSPNGDEKKRFEEVYKQEIEGNATLNSVDSKSSKFGFTATFQNNILSDEIKTKIESSKSGVIAVGSGTSAFRSDVEDLIAKSSWPVLCDITSNFRHVGGVISTYDTVFRQESGKSLLPDVVIQIGEPLTSKLFNEKTSGSYCVAVKNVDDRRNPHGNVDAEVFINQTNEEPFSEIMKALDKTDSITRDNWINAQDKALSLISEVKLGNIDSEPALFLDLGAKLAELEQPIQILLASSMPVRYAEWFWPKSSALTTVYSHRGTNGIDGMLSSCYGIAHGSKSPTLCVLGDVTFRHDIGFLSSCASFTSKESECLVFALVDNGGGAIFRHLEQAKSKSMDPFYVELLQTPTGIDFEAMVLASNASYFTGSNQECVEKIESLIKNCVAGTHVVHCKVAHGSGPEFMAALSS